MFESHFWMSCFDVVTLQLKWDSVVLGNQLAASGYGVRQVQADAAHSFGLSLKFVR